MWKTHKNLQVNENEMETTREERERELFKVNQSNNWKFKKDKWRNK